MAISTQAITPQPAFAGLTKIYMNHQAPVSVIDRLKTSVTDYAAKHPSEVTVLPDQTVKAEYGLDPAVAMVVRTPNTVTFNSHDNELRHLAGVQMKYEQFVDPTDPLGEFRSNIDYTA